MCAEIVREREWRVGIDQERVKAGRARGESNCTEMRGERRTDRDGRERDRGASKPSFSAIEQGRPLEAMRKESGELDSKSEKEREKRKQ